MGEQATKPLKRKNRRPIPKMGFYAVRMAEDMRERLRLVAEKRTFARGTPVYMSELIREYISEGIRREQK